MSLPDEIQKLQQLRQSGALSEAEFAQAKASLLNAPPEPAPPTSGRGALATQVEHRHLENLGHLEQIAFQNELARLDREWALERESFMVSGHHGRRSIPTQGGSVAGGIAIALFGGFWTAGAASTGAPAFFPLFGVLFIAVGVGSAIRSFSKAGGYREANERYQQRRAQLLARAPRR